MITIQELRTSPGDVTVPVIGEITKLIRNESGGEGAQAWKFQCVMLADATGSIEAKVWKKAPLHVGARVEFCPSAAGSGLSVEIDPKYGPKLIVQESATITAHIGEAAPVSQGEINVGTMDNPGLTIPAYGAQSRPTPGQSALSPTLPNELPDRDKERDKIIRDNADLVIRAYDAVVKHVVPQVKERNGYHLNADQIRAAVESIIIYTQKQLNYR